MDFLQWTKWWDRRESSKEVHIKKKEAILLVKGWILILWLIYKAMIDELKGAIDSLLKVKSPVHLSRSHLVPPIQAILPVLNWIWNLIFLSKFWKFISSLRVFLIGYAGKSFAVLSSRNQRVFSLCQWREKRLEESVTWACWIFRVIVCLF